MILLPSGYSILCNRPAGVCIWIAIMSVDKITSARLLNRVACSRAAGVPRGNYIGPRTKTDIKQT